MLQTFQKFENKTKWEMITRETMEVMCPDEGNVHFVIITFIPVVPFTAFKGTFTIYDTVDFFKHIGFVDNKLYIMTIYIQLTHLLL